ncbi:hypothetical protein ACIP5Y_23680 [Nocardia sp. NPDC088792]|uniref:hypothetical protein n=1 Tax=Nocardia sp. NPDC088792 TaxID=3364332 RepID=UPI00381C5CC9
MEERPRKSKGDKDMDGGFVCILVVVGVVALLIYMSNQKASNRYRADCGECSHQSAWLSESEAEAASIRHYRSKHPDLPPGGTMQIRAR